MPKPIQIEIELPDECAIRLTQEFGVVGDNPPNQESWYSQICWHNGATTDGHRAHTTIEAAGYALLRYWQEGAVDDTIILAPAGYLCRLE